MRKQIITTLLFLSTLLSFSETSNISFFRSNMEIEGINFSMMNSNNEVTGVNFSLVGSELESLIGINGGIFFGLSPYVKINNGLKGVSGSLIGMYGGKSRGVVLGAVNVSENFEGIEFGAINYTKKKSIIQIGGINRGDEVILQIGALNFAKNLRGVQIGILNFADNGVLPIVPGVNFSTTIF